MLCRWESEALKLGFIQRVDQGRMNVTWRFKRWPFVGVNEFRLVSEETVPEGLSVHMGFKGHTE